MTSPLEIAANVLVTLSILLAGRNSVHTWWTGMAGCGLFAVVFAQQALYADVTLQIFFIVTSAFGWRRWRAGAAAPALAVSRAGVRVLAWAVPAGLLATLAYGMLLHFWTDAYAPFADSAVLAFSVIAQFLLMGRRLENWAFWLLVNSIAVPLYLSRGLTLTAVLYAGYWINALVSWRRWRRMAGPATPSADGAVAG